MAGRVTGKNILEGRFITRTNNLIYVHSGYLRIISSLGFLGLLFYLLWIISTLGATLRFSRIVEILGHTRLRFVDGDF